MRTTFKHRIGNSIILGMVLFLFVGCGASAPSPNGVAGTPASKGIGASSEGGLSVFPTEVLAPSASSASATPSSSPTPIPTATSVDTATSTPQPSPTSTPVPPSATPQPPTASPVPPTATRRPPPTNTSQPPPVVPPTATATTVPQGLNGNPWGYNWSCCNLITAPAAEFCKYFACIASFWAGRGHVEQCRDATFSKSGGISGSCSSHGGDSRPLYAP
jgi:hypothetical protein